MPFDRLGIIVYVISSPPFSLPATLRFLDMALTSCRECGTDVPGNAHACPRCGASMAPAALPAYRPAPRPPAPPERPWWRTVGGWMSAAGWTVIVGALALLAFSFVRGSMEAGRRETEKAEVAREEEYRRRVNVYVQDTSANAAVPERAGLSVPASDRARRMWVVSRMLVDRSSREREILERHGVRRTMSMTTWLTPRYQADARAFPEVGRYLEGRAAATAEIRKTSAAWMEERTAALARESGMPVQEIRALFPPDFAGVTEEEARLDDVMLEFHRHFVRVDPRVHHAGGKELRFEREDDVHRGNELVVTVNAATAAADRARERRLAVERAALARAIE